MRAYEIAFGDFEQRLWSDTNVISTGGDLLVLALAGLGATTGSAATASALAAASAGVVGAQATVSKDLYYQRTLPALLAQMEANRDTIKLSLINGLKEADEKYSLFQADLDLEALQRASGISAAVTNITQQASTNQMAAQAKLAQPTYMIAPLPKALADRKKAFADYVRGLVSAKDQTTLDALADAFSVPHGATLIEESSNIRFTMNGQVQTTQNMDALSTRLSPITKKEF